MLNTVTSEEFLALSMKEKVEILRAKGARKELTIEDMKYVVKYLREDRTQIVAKTKEKKVKEVIDAKAQGDELLANLKGSLGI